MQRRLLLALALSVTAALALVDISCAKPDTGPGVSTGQCPGGLDSCGGVCVDVQTNADNCGSCGHGCGSGQLCSNGACQCQSGFMACSGTCVNIANDPAHCGSCSNACTGSDVCDHGSCSSTCSAGTTLCDRSCASLSSDASNCGSCGHVCPAGQGCSNSQCGCPIGQTLCGSTCIDTNTNAANCGTCGHTCGGTQICSSGACGCGANQVVCSDQVTCAASIAQCPGATGSGGSGGAGGGAGGSGGTGSIRPVACAAGPNVIADFEDGTDTEVVQGGRTGWWFTFADALGGNIMQAPNQAGPIAAATLPSTDPAFGSCNHYAFHVTATGRQGSNTSAYAGFGASLAQVMPTPPAGSRTKNPYDVSAYKGISFSIKSGTANPPPMWFEIVNTETSGSPAGSPASPDGTATHPSVDLYNTRGKLFTDITTTWQTKFVPFGLMGPRYLPACTTLPTAACNDSTFYEAPGFNPRSALGIQMAMYPQFTSASAFDIWIDDVRLVTDDSGVATFTPSSGTAKPFPRDAAVGTCSKPAGASGTFLVDAYVRWKNTFVTGTGSNTRVQRPENANDTVSEGIAYGMLIAAMMGDKTLFDGLWGFWTGHSIGAPNNLLMNWCIPINGAGGTGSACPATGGSATDADEDTAYALLLASKQWGGSPAGGSTTYLSLATTMIGQIWAAEIDTAAMLPTGGSNYRNGNVNSVNNPATNPSYFAPAYYRIFGTIDTAHAWSGANGADGGVVAAVYRALANSGVNRGGLVPAWCSNNCTGPGSNGAADDGIYQYDAHRVPWRIGVDACWNNNASARTFLSGNTGFFVGKSRIPAGSASGGLGSVVDIYTLAGAPNGDAKVNSMSAVGSAGVGAMANAAGNATNQDFLNRAYRFILDANYTFDPAARTSAYTYFNASVGLLTALTMSGNFPDYRNF